MNPNEQIPGGSATLPSLLCAQARQFGKDKVALREKEFGIWQEVTWQEYLDNVKAFSLGLSRLGLRPGEAVSIIGDNRPEWLYTELGAQAAGGIAVGIYQDSLPEQVRYIVDHSDSAFAMVEDQEQADKVLAVKDRLPKLRKIIVDDLKGMRGYTDPLLVSFRETQELGRELDAGEPRRFREQVASLKPDDIAILAYTSGTTGLPKGSMLTHRNMLNMATNLLAVDPMFPADEFVSYLPFPWIGEQMMAVSCGLMAGFTVNFPEEVETVRENIREIGPHIMLAPPRIWEKLCSAVQVKMQDATPLKRAAYHVCMATGAGTAERKLRGRAIPPWWWAAWAIAELAMFRPLRDKLGLSRARSVYTGGAALGPEIFSFFQAIGLNIRQVYGQTEISGISCLHRGDDVKLDTVGKPIPGTEIRISDRGEILSRSESVFAGYYKDPEATTKAKEDGWLHSGDAGLLDEDGHLIVIDRMKDVMQLSDGSKFSPQLIENKLKFSPHIRESVVIGKDRPYITSLIQIDMENVGKWAEDRQIPYTTFKDLSQKPEVAELIAREVERVNKDLPKVAQIRRFVLLDKELDADDDELTRTQKVRRVLIVERYSHLIEPMYQNPQ